MYIKIKHIKQFLLISACIFFAGFNYFSYVKADDTKNGNQKSCDKSIDSDCDGLTNSEEKLYGTDPNNSDTDGDGYSDGVEVKSGYDPLKPAPGDKLLSNNSNVDELLNKKQPIASPSLTDSYIQNFKQFLSSKDNKQITTADIQDFNNTELSDKIIPVTEDSLPIFDGSHLAILPQTYSELSISDKKQKLNEDAIHYLLQVAYLLESNAPVTITNSDELDSFREVFENHISNPADPTNTEYFADMSNRLDIFLQQYNGLEVPETMTGLHIKFSRIVMGILLLRDSGNSNINDPMSKIILLNKAHDLALILQNFISNDVSNYFKQIEIDSN
ncbi:MAG: hypothetical protein PHW24_03315 [Candidatus Moranbacteria bacterium]|nr:hypothetical protein [Candidatus Moranbacteria bacterium]